MRVIRWVGALLVLLAAIIAVAWAFGAVWFDAPFGNANKVSAGLLAAVYAIAVVFVRPFWRKVGVIALIFGGVLTWWLTLTPTNTGVRNRTWPKSVARHQVNQVTLHAVQLRLPDRNQLHAAWETHHAQLAESLALTWRSITGARPGCTSHRQLSIR